MMLRRPSFSLFASAKKADSGENNKSPEASPAKQPEESSNSNANLNPKNIFTLLKKIGKGTYGEVFKAIDKRNDSICAIKIVALDEPKVIEDMRQEVNILSQISHGNLLKYLGSYLDIGRIWLSLEYCEGGSITSIAQSMSASLKEEYIVAICKQILRVSPHLELNLSGIKIPSFQKYYSSKLKRI